MKLSKQDRAVLDEAAAILERMAKEKPAQYFVSSRDTKEIIRHRLSGLESEEFHVLFLDAHNGLIEARKMFNGTIDGAAVYPREVVKAALELNAAAVLFAHNHPSGKPDPSLADKAIARRLQDALNIVDVRVLDHLIVGRDEILSFAEKGLI